MLDNKFGEKAKTDIKSLSLEGMEKREEKWFDVERDITENDIKMLKRELARHQISRDDARDTTELASAMRILAIEPEITSEGQEAINVWFAHYRSTESWQSFAANASEMRILGMEPEITVNDKQKMKERLTDFRLKNDWWSFAHLASKLRIVDIEPEVTAEDREKLKEKLADFRNRDRWLFSSLILFMRILGMESELTAEDREWLKEKVAKSRNEGNWTSFAGFALEMRILAADEIKVGGPKGLEIIDSKSRQGLKTTIPPLPDKRKF